MQKTSKKILFFGNERLATGVSSTAPTLRALILAGYEVTALISNYTPAHSRKNREPEIHGVARQHSIPILSPKKMSDIYDEIRKMDVDIGVLVAFGKIVPKSIIELFPSGIINLHPSLLPKHRGSTPIESAILQGEDATGVSIMQLVSKMDAGPVYAQQAIKLSGTETKQYLADKLLQLGSEMIITVLPAILNAKLEPKQQSETAATYDRPIQKDDGTIDWRNDAKLIERQLRSYHSWPQSKTTLNKIEVIITSGHIIDKLPKGAQPGDIFINVETPLITVATSDGLIAIDTVKPLGKKDMSVNSFIAGYKEKIGSL